MAQKEDTISHFSHPGHELVKRHYIGPSFLCDMCWEHLSGPGYGCSAGCDFGIHESCAGHPQTHSSQAHHAHPLVLVQTRRDVVAHICDVCAGRCAAGCFLYRCPPCGFDMHPRCARLPQVVRSSRHSQHDLTLVVADGRCAAACGGGAGRAWYYRCTACNVDFHVSCAATAGDNNDGARQDADTVVEQIHQASAAQMRIQAAMMQARLRVQGSRNALDLVSPSYPESYTIRRDYFF
ncbi:uncharacterized protein LOC120669728 [Panicum virgatum]|uniref:DC1 domain-containing protein n=1 Tax=Panicum virgatum TaxID=38727 RepID=A0A8T0T662_PANVG|nr:uncharacterized protein LOC120669728 [Panicum virgatum]KAG2607182.1 hypothetical protein PVAP13_4NG183411 [Panicum virgatum]